MNIVIVDSWSQLGCEESLLSFLWCYRLSCASRSAISASVAPRLSSLLCSSVESSLPPARSAASFSNWRSFFVSAFSCFPGSIGWAGSAGGGAAAAAAADAGTGAALVPADIVAPFSFSVACATLASPSSSWSFSSSSSVSVLSPPSWAPLAAHAARRAADCRARFCCRASALADGTTTVGAGGDERDSAS